MSAPDREPADPRLDELLQRVRRVVEERRRSGDPSPAPQPLFPDEPVEGSDFFPWRKPAPGTAPPGTIAANDLLELQPDRFVTRLFHAVAGRDPSPAELDRWTARVARHSWQRVVAVLGVRLSRSGRARALPLRVRWGPFVRLATGALVERIRARSRRP